MPQSYCSWWTLTYMSIQDEIDAHIVGKRLFSLSSAIRSEGTGRDLILNSDVMAITRLDGGWTSNQRYRLAKARGELDRYTTGRRISLMLRPKRGPTAFLKRLDPVNREVWEIRCCEPKPGVRVVGRFAEPNLFIGLCWEFRESLRGTEWDALCDRCLNEWQRLFPSRAAHNGRSVYDYVSRNVFPI
jgi:hypothetical protein